VVGLPAFGCSWAMDGAHDRGRMRRRHAKSRTRPYPQMVQDAPCRSRAAPERRRAPARARRRERRPWSGGAGSGRARLGAAAPHASLRRLKRAGGRRALAAVPCARLWAPDPDAARSRQARAGLPVWLRKRMRAAASVARAAPAGAGGGARASRAQIPEPVGARTAGGARAGGGAGAARARAAAGPLRGERGDAVSQGQDLRLHGAAVRRRVRSGLQAPHRIRAAPPPCPGCLPRHCIRGADRPAPLRTRLSAPPQPHPASGFARSPWYARGHDMRHQRAAGNAPRRADLWSPTYAGHATHRAPQT